MSTWCVWSFTQLKYNNFELLVSNCSQKYATSGAKNHGMHIFSPADVSLGVCMPKSNSEMTISNSSLHVYIHARLTVTEHTCRGTQLISYVTAGRVRKLNSAYRNGNVAM